MNLRPTSASNPFSTRFIRPGAVTYHFPEGISAVGLTQQFLQQHLGRAAIVGPHGSGKTSLLYALSPHLGQVVESHLCSGDPLPPDVPGGAEFSQQSRGLRIFWFRLMMRSREYSRHAQSSNLKSSKSLRALMKSRRNWGSDSLVLIDGWEQMRWPMRGWVYWNVKRANAKLLVTSHQKTLLPTLWDSSVRPEIAQKVVHELLGTAAEDSQPLFSRWLAQVSSTQSLQQALLENRGSLREVLFLMYDEYERTCRRDSERTS